MQLPERQTPGNEHLREQQRRSRKKSLESQSRLPSRRRRRRRLWRLCKANVGFQSTCYGCALSRYTLEHPNRIYFGWREKSSTKPDTWQVFSLADGNIGLLLLLFSICEPPRPVVAGARQLASRPAPEACRWTLPVGRRRMSSQALGLKQTTAAAVRQSMANATNPIGTVTCLSIQCFDSIRAMDVSSSS